MIPTASRTRSAPPPSGPTTRSATSSWPGCAGCRPSAASAPTTARWSSSATPRPARRRRASTRRSTPTSSSSGSRGPTPGSSRAATPTSPRSATSAGRSSSTPARRATSSTATRPPPGRSSTSSSGDVDRGDPADRVRRARRRQRDLGARPARRRLPRRHGPHREARPMTERPTASSSPAWAPSRRSATTSPRTWEGLVAGRSGVAHDRVVRPVAADVADRGRGPRLRRQRTSSTARTCAGRTATSSSGWWPPARRSTRPGCRSASRASSPSGPA